MATKKRTATAAPVESDSTATPNETQVAEQATQAVEAAAQATIADVVSEEYDNDAAEGIACALTLRDGRKLVGACARSDDLTLGAMQQAAYFAALGAV